MKRAKQRQRFLHIPDKISIRCQYCNKIFAINIDPSAGIEQQFEYDCEFCCRPLVVTIHIDQHGKLEASTTREM